MAETDMPTADVERLAQELRDYAAENPTAPIAVRAAAGWLVDLARHRDAALNVVTEAELWRDRVSGLILGSHELPLADAVDEWRNRGQ